MSVSYEDLYIAGWKDFFGNEVEVFISQEIRTLAFKLSDFRF